jgi:hypothetical protein
MPNLSIQASAFTFCGRRDWLPKLLLVFQQVLVIDDVDRSDGSGWEVVISLNDLFGGTMREIERGLLPPICACFGLMLVCGDWRPLSHE